MKKLLGILVLGLLLFIESTEAAKKGKGEVKLSQRSLDNFIDYIRGAVVNGERWTPMMFILSSDGQWSNFWYCPYSECRDAESNRTIAECQQATNVQCGVFAKRRTIYWDNGHNKKKPRINSKWSEAKIKEELTKAGFWGDENTSTKEEKKKETKTAKITTGKRSLAMSWKGYNNLILGSLTFKEEDLVGKINVKLPNNDGNCKGTYALSTEKGTWSLLCTNDMSASGTLKWNNQDGSVTGKGKDTEGNAVKFTVEGES